jgi:SAM-dependent methyltransferase
MPQNVFDERIAARYDDDPSPPFDAGVIAATVEVLADLAGAGRALELAVGTGRIALPLARRGVAVHGIEISAAMVARLREKPGADSVDVTMGDMAAVRVPGTFSLVYLVFNTIMNLTSQDEQVACFANAARHLAPGGRFVIECMVPDLQRLPPGETVRPFDVSPAHLGIDEYDVANQRLWSHHYTRVGDRFEATVGEFRYVWPAELDLMARLAGMTLRHRWAGWDRSPFTSDSRLHVSVWTRPV